MREENMKKLIMMCLVFYFSYSFLHMRLFLSVDDNKDGTIYIEAGFSNGEKADGMEFFYSKG